MIGLRGGTSMHLMCWIDKLIPRRAILQSNSPLRTSTEVRRLEIPVGPSPRVPFMALYYASF